jgi:hypothetical protein
MPLVTVVELQLVAQRTVDVEVGEEDMRKAFDKVLFALRAANSCCSRCANNVAASFLSIAIIQLDVDRKGFITTNDIR